DTEQLTVEKYLNRWLAMASAKLRPNSYNRYEQHIRLHLVPHLGTIRLNKLTAFHVEQLYAEMCRDKTDRDGAIKAGASRSECQKVGKLLRSALKSAVRRGLLPHNVANDVPLPRPAKAEINPLDADEAAKLIEAAAKDRLYALYVLALDT